MKNGGDEEEAKKSVDEFKVKKKKTNLVFVDKTVMKEIRDKSRLSNFKDDRN